jgi:tetratricopeptide (TPR) repeat protein
MASVVLAAGIVAVFAPAQTPPAAPKGTPAKATSDIELVEKLNATRKQYQATLEQLRQHYISAGEVEKSKWAEDELKHFHRLVKYAYRLDIDVPVPTLQAKNNIPEANELFRDAMKYKDKGFGNEYIDNQRRAEILFQRLLDHYPESDKIGEAAYQLGDIYEKYRPTPQYPRAAAYFERSFQWNKTRHDDARLRAARLYDKHINDREKARAIYKEVLNHDTDNNRVQEAKRRLEELR